MLRHRISGRAFVAITAAVACLAMASTSRAIDPGLSLAIGYTQLQTELGAATPNGAGVTVAQMEADEGNANGNAFIPDTTNSDLIGRNYTIETSGSAGASGHATQVAQNFYGTTGSMTGGVTNIQLWSADAWIDNSIRLGTTLVPQVQTAKVSNHSYMGDAGSYNLEVLLRLDFVIDRDKTVVVVAMNNGDSTIVPVIWGQAYNTISVGLSNGNNSHGMTTIYGAGRQKPDIVVPSPTGLTSFATPVVSSAATLLVGVAQSTPALSDATNPEVVKSLLMAGATKDTLPSWSNSSSHPLDSTYGAGQLNIDRSYHILSAGEQHASNTTAVGAIGWDYNTTAASAKTYFVNLSGATSSLSAVLNWNIAVTDMNDPNGTSFNPIGTLANLDLTLYSSSGMVVGSSIAVSDSTVDNVELIYLTNLAAGQYALQVTSPTSSVNYALSWEADVPEPGTAAAGLLFVTLAISRRKRALR